MKILRGRVDWGKDNIRPSLYLLVDEVPERDDMRFVQREEFYFAEKRGFCRFFAGRRDGFTFARQTKTPAILLRMLDGTERAIWPVDGEARRANELGLGPCMEVYYTRNEDVYEQGFTFNVGLVLVSWLREQAAAIDVGYGYTWRTKASYAAEVAFPRGSRFMLACTGYATIYRRDYRDRRFVSRPELFPDGSLVENVRDAIRAALAADDHDLANEIARRYSRHLPGGDVDTILALEGYEPAVKLPDGSFWAKPA